VTPALDDAFTVNGVPHVGTRMFLAMICFNDDDVGADIMIFVRWGPLLVLADVGAGGGVDMMRTILPSGRRKRLNFWI